MALGAHLRRTLAAGLSLTASLLEPAQPAAAANDAPAVEARGVRPWRKTSRKPRIAPLPVTRTRWLQSDIEHAELMAAGGDLTLAAQLYRAFQRDGTLQGLLGTRTGGLVRLPKAFLGTPAAVAALEGTGGEPGAFAKYFPQAEVQRMVDDGIVLGVSVGMFIQGTLDTHPKLVRLDPEFLLYRASEDRWYYRSMTGLLPITPGDGQWVLHTPYGRYEPWNRGLWKSLARAFIAKEHAFLHRENYAGKLANPARVAVSPQGAAERQKQSWFRAVMAWGVNSVFGVTPGYDVKLIESNGRGYEVFAAIIETSNLEIIVGLAGQVVTTTGGVGFANADIHATIRGDLIQGDGNAIAATLNEQALGPVIVDLVGPANDNASVAWDTRPPADLTSGAESLSAAAAAINDLTAALKAHGIELDVAAICTRFAVPVRGDRNGDAVPDVEPEPAGELEPEAPPAAPSEPQELAA